MKEFFAELGPGWELTDRQRARLAPLVAAALGAGWSPARLAEATGANRNGIRSPYAVLKSRLSAGELPPAPDVLAARPPWCGTCDQATRMLDYDGDAPRPCPRCKPPVPALNGADSAGERLHATCSTRLRRR